MLKGHLTADNNGFKLTVIQSTPWSIHAPKGISKSSNALLLGESVLRLTLPTLTMSGVAADADADAGIADADAITDTGATAPTADTIT